MRVPHLMDQPRESHLKGLTLLVALGFLTIAPHVRGQPADRTPLPSSPPVAVVDGKAISLAEVDETIKPQLYELVQRIYALRKAALDKLILDAVVRREARAQQMSATELTQKLIPDRVEIPESRIEREYAENASGFTDVREDEARMRIRAELEAQERLQQYRANVEALRAKARVQISLAAPEQPRVTFAPTKLTRGREDAPVTVVEFSDFQCPYCRKASATVHQLVERYGDNVRIQFKQFPLSIHPNAFPAARASVCAAEQGRFWEYHDRLFATGEATPDALAEAATSVGLDAQRFKGCMASEASAEAVRQDMREGSKLGIRGTPTFFVNGIAMNDDHGFERFTAVIDEQLRARPAGKTRVARTEVSNEGQNHARQ